MLSISLPILFKNTIPTTYCDYCNIIGHPELPGLIATSVYMRPFSIPDIIPWLIFNYDVDNGYPAHIIF